MSEVNRYRIVVYGSSEDKPHLKAKVELYSWEGQTATSLGKIRFYQGGELPLDVQKKGAAEMNLPAEMLEPVLGLLHGESPVYFAYHEGRAVLGTAIRPVGAATSTACGGSQVAPSSCSRSTARTTWRSGTGSPT